MMKIKILNIFSMAEKTFKNLIANKAILFMMILYPILAIVFRMMFPLDRYIEPLKSFYVMNITMIPILIMSSIIAEEKEKGIIKYLILSGVSYIEYLIGTIFCILIGVTISSMLYSILLLPNKIYGDMTYFLITILGAMPSILLGCIIGMKTNNQVEVGAKAAPIAMVIGMLPMFKGNNVFVDNVINKIYSSVIFNYMDGKVKMENLTSIIIVFINILILSFLFSIVYKNSKLDRN